MLVLSDLHGASSVRNLSLKFIVDNWKEIVAQDDWREKLKVVTTIFLYWIYIYIYSDVPGDYGRYVRSYDQTTLD